MRQTLLVVLFVSLLALSLANKDCRGRPREISPCRPANREVYFTYRGGRCERIRGCYRKNADNLFRDRSRCVRRCERRG